MGKVLKPDFKGKDFNQMIKDNPDKAEYYSSFINDYDYSDIDLEGLTPEEIYQKGNDNKDGLGDTFWASDLSKKYYQAAAENGSTAAMLAIAHCYRTATFPFYTKAMYWYKKASEKGSAAAKFYIGEMYEKGEGIEQDFKQAVHWYEEAGKCTLIEADNQENSRGINWNNRSLNCAGCIYYRGEEGVPQDCAKALECFKKTTESDENDYEPYFYLGIEYLKGGVIEQDYEKAFFYFEKAEKKGFYAALDCIDYMYETGKVKNGKYKTASEWYVNTETYGKAAEQLGYVFTNFDDFASEMDDYHKRIISALPKETLLSRVYNNLCTNEDVYNKGVFWYEASAETLYERAFYQLILIYNYNISNGLDKPPGAEKIAYIINKFYPLSDNDKNIKFTQDDCNELLNRMLAFSEIARREGLLSFESLMEDEKNIFIKTGFTLVSNGIDFDIVRIIVENLLDMGKREGYDLTARKIILQGIVSVHQGENPNVVKSKIDDIIGEDINALNEEWKKKQKEIKFDNADLYYERGKIFFYRDDYNEAISDFETAYSLSDDDFDRKTYHSLLVKVWEIKQKNQTPEERRELHAKTVEKIKSEASSVNIGTFFNLKTAGEYTELAAILASFEEYDLIERLLKEASDSNLQILNTLTRPQFRYWQPSLGYYVTTKDVLKRMKDPKKMLKFLAEKGADVSLAAGDGSTPLWNQTCTDCESEEILKTLLELGADPNQISINNDTEWTPLVHCLLPTSSENNPQDEEASDEENLDPIDNASIRKAELLLEYGADANLIASGLPGFSPLVIAVNNYKFAMKHISDETYKDNISGILKLIELLIKKGADINFLDSFSNTPLSIAQRDNLSEVEEILLEHGALLPDELEEQDDGKHDAWI
ncbi:MAG: hypothetical protein FWB86_04710 [Treponema sp.]|nr:hypothetical protein [Treponema sp.]MCL2250733.1 hypothetical protein [Treponema sp.]